MQGFSCYLGVEADENEGKLTKWVCNHVITSLSLIVGRLQFFTVYYFIKGPIENYH